MREIKFRAWYEPAKKMFNVDVLAISPVGWDSEGTGVSLAYQPSIPVMQYTGLKDKNDVEIYEGDVLTSEFYPFQDDGEPNYHGVIEWIDELASFYMTKRLANSDKRGISDGISEQIERIEEFEVIGNIYENPELLEVPE